MLETNFVTLKNNWKSDLVSGFFVFLLALPLSLGIAKASGFPAAMGIFSAMVAGILTSFFRVSALSIKGPAAGLITICSGAILEFGGGEEAWQIAAAAIVVAAVLQIVFGFLRFGTISALFPYSVVFGMLAAIGIIILAKQIPVLLGVDPANYEDKNPLKLLLEIPQFISNANFEIALIGFLGILIMFGLPALKFSFTKKIPAPLVVLLLAIPLGLYFQFQSEAPDYALVQIGDFWGELKIRADFSWFGTFSFWKYALMFLLVGTLESLLTVKAVDNIDPERRKSDYNSDLKALGFGNFVAGLFGGLPTISEVVRSSSNITFGAKSKWSNFFHGVFLLLAMLLLIPQIELIPNAALAAMLIYAGYRLANPMNFIQIWRIGKEQMLIFLVTVIVTLLEDLLIGIFAGMLIKIILHLLNGVALKDLFIARYRIDEEDTVIRISILYAAIFTHLMKYNMVFSNFSNKKEIVVDFSQCKLIDHSFMLFLNGFTNHQESHVKNVRIQGLDKHKAISKHVFATRKLKIKNTQI
jgi:MFS superfamily sulfate permease-like transporter